VRRPAALSGLWPEPRRVGRVEPQGLLTEMEGKTMRTATIGLRCVRALAVLAAAGAMALATPEAGAQNRRNRGNSGNQPAATGASVLDGLMKRGRERDWTLTVTIQVNSVKNRDGNGMPIPETMNLRTAAVVFPAIESFASGVLDSERYKGELRFNEKVVDDSHEFLSGYQGGTRLARWTMTEQVGKDMTLVVTLPVTTWETIFDENAAMAVPWPANWSDRASSALQPDTIVNSNDPAVQALVKRWTEGKDPKSIPPVQLAKFLAGKVMEHVQLSGNGLVAADNGLLMGVGLQSVEETATSGRGSEHDMVVLLAAVYRAAGLPARTVIGYDVTGKKEKDNFLDKGRGSGSGMQLRGWVEFCLYDEGTKKELWVPVDIVRMRGSSNRVPPLNRPWKYFGTHDELENVIPFALQYHPPTTVVAHGAYAFWGWLTTPEIPNVTQFVRFNAITTPKRAGDRPRDQR